MAKFVHIGLSLDPQIEVTLRCDEFAVGDNDEIQVFVGDELWGHFPESIYAYIEDDEEDTEPRATARDEEDEDDGDDEADMSTYESVNLSSPSTNGSGPVEAVDSKLLN